MTRFCPICGTHNEAAALKCQCGRVFTEDVKAAQSLQAVELKRYKRKLIMQKAGALLGAVTIFLFFAAYVGGFFAMQGKADVEEKPSPVVAEAPPVVTQPAAPNPVFPEVHVPYKATRAITGSVIAVTDADGQERRVTLLGMRVPKLDENFGVESKENLWTLIANNPF